MESFLETIFFPIIFPMIFVLIGAGILANALRLLHRGISSRSWPTVDGHVIRTEITTKTVSGKHGRRTVYVPSITYQFTIAGITHTGTRLGMSDDHYPAPGNAELVTLRYPVGTKVTVHHHRDKPDICLLYPGIPAGTWIMLPFGAFFLLFGLIFLIAFKSSPR